MTDISSELLVEIILCRPTRMIETDSLKLDDVFLVFLSLPAPVKMFRYKRNARPKLKICSERVLLLHCKTMD